MHTRTRAAAALLAAAALGGGLSACGSSHSTAPSAGAQPSRRAAAPSSTSGASNTTAASSTASGGAPASTAASSGGLTKAGSTLQIGQTAHVTFTTGTGPQYPFAITVHSITAGSMSDFKNVSLTGVPPGATPTYVKVTLTNTGTRALATSSGDPSLDIGASEPDGIDGDVSLVGSFPPCPQVDPPKRYLPGQSYSTCEIFMERGKVSAIGYDGGMDTIDQPILWSAS